MPAALRAAGYRCEAHDDHFDQDTPDDEWMRSVAEHQWIVLTKDERIRYRPLELGALLSARVRAFILVSGNLRGVDTANILLKAMARIEAALESRRGPFIYYVYKNSTIKRVMRLR